MTVMTDFDVQRYTVMLYLPTTKNIMSLLKHACLALTVGHL